MITSLLRRIAKLAWLLPGFLLWAAFPPMGEHFDCLFALAPMMWFARRSDMKGAFKRWFLCGCIFWGATLSWFPAIIKNGGPWPLVVLGWAGLSAYCALYFGLFGLGSAFYWNWVKRDGRYWKRLAGLLFFEPILWAGLELVRSRLFSGFSWNQLGVAPANCGFGAPAALGGVYLLSAIVILINGTFASIAERVLAPVMDRFAAKPSVPNWARSVETILPFLLIWGLYSLPSSQKEIASTVDLDLQPRPTLSADLDLQPRPTLSADLDLQPRPTLSVGLVQRNFPCCFKEGAENPYAIYSKLLEPLKALRPDLIVLPESALAEFGAIGSSGAARFARFVTEETGAAVLAGGTRLAGGKIYNSAALYSAQDPSAEPQAYDKVHLVPFGEYIPGDKMFPILQNLAPVGSCTAGTEKLLLLPTTNYQLSTTNSLPLAVSICYEDTDSALVRDFARAGARALVFITNDSWFSGSIETLQHAWNARVRAIETGLPVVRVGNSGVSGVIAPDGKVEALCGPDGHPLVDARGTMLGRIDVSARPATFYVRFGDTPLAILFLLLILLCVVIKYTTNHAKRRTMSL